jgi:hypothetical protein
MTAPSEHAEQAAFVAWFRAQFPDTLIFAIPNGAHLAGTVGQRAAKMAKLKAEGFVPGIPDLCVPAWRTMIEMKRAKGGRVSADQAATHDALSKAGWLVIVAKGCDDAMARVRAEVDFMRAIEEAVNEPAS